MITLRIKDETAAGKLLNEVALEFEEAYITAEALITARIREEVSSYQNKASVHKSGLVVPSNLEQRLNSKSAPKIDVEKQIYIALDAFKKNAFFVLIDDEQVESLDQQFFISDTTDVSFIKLTPLVGG